MRTATKQIQAGTRQLQESFAHARERLSMGERKSTNSATSSFSDSEQQQHQGEHHQHHHNLLPHIRLSFPSLGSSTHSHDSQPRNHHRLNLFAKRSSQGSSDGEGINNTSGNSENSPMRRIEPRLSQISRTSSVISSAGSFCSTDELPMTLDEEDEDKLKEELDEDEESVEDPQVMTPNLPTKLNGENDGSNQEKAPVQTDPQDPARKKRKKKEKNGKCTIQ
jgi:hypothetical protein